MMGWLLACCSLLALADLEGGAVRAKVKAPDRKAISTLVRTIRSDPSESVRCEAVKDLAALAPNDPEVVSVLIRALRRDPSESVRSHAVEALASFAPHGPEVVSVLLHTLQSDRSSDVRSY